MILPDEVLRSLTVRTATIDDRGIIVDRRAGRIATGKNREICHFLGNEIKEVEGVRFPFIPGEWLREITLPRAF